MVFMVVVQLVGAFWRGLAIVVAVRGCMRVCVCVCDIGGSGGGRYEVVQKTCVCVRM